MQIWCKGDSTEQPPSIRCSPSAAFFRPNPPWFVLLLCHPGLHHRLTCLNEALSVTALKNDSFINKVSFPVQRYCPGIHFTYSLLNFPVLLTLAVIFLSSQDPEVTASKFWRYWLLTVDSGRQMDLSGDTDSTSICQRQSWGFVAAQ